MDPGGGGGRELYAIRSEQEVVFVVFGTVVINVDGTEHNLKSGDTLTFDPRRPHSFWNASEQRPAQALLILTPPPL